MWMSQKVLRLHCLKAMHVVTVFTVAPFSRTHTLIANALSSQGHKSLYAQLAVLPTQ